MKIETNIKSERNLINVDNKFPIINDNLIILKQEVVIEDNEMYDFKKSKKEEVIYLLKIVNRMLPILQRYEFHLFRLRPSYMRNVFQRIC
jgi:hypothetical protein